MLLVLAAVQFTHAIDFMIMMPLGPRYLRELSISPSQFGLLVSAYAFSACGSGLLAASIIDHFDRKRALLVLYAGFTFGTFCCAIAGSYESLLLARCVAGAFGGVLGAMVLAVVGDAFPEERRGLAMGVVMSSFSVATILGVPAGLVLADLRGTGAPFAALAGLSAVLLLAAGAILPPLRHHLEGHAGPRSPTWQVLTRPAHLRAYALMGCLVLSTFTIIPHLATFLVANVGWREADLRWLYLCGGAATLTTMTLFGRLADRLGKLPVFRVLALLTMGPIVLLTNLSQTALGPTLVLTTLFMVVSSGRMVPAMALITSSAAPAYRGSFMSVNASVQQLTAGLAALVAGVLLSQPVPGGPLEGYPLVGALGCVMTLVSVVLAGYVRTVAVDEAALREPAALLAETAAATVPLSETVESVP